MKQKLILTTTLAIILIPLATALNISDANTAITFDANNFNGTHHLDITGNNNHLQINNGSARNATGIINEGDFTSKPNGLNYIELTQLPNQFSICFAFNSSNIVTPASWQPEFLGSDYSGTGGDGFDFYAGLTGTDLSVQFYVYENSAAQDRTIEWNATNKIITNQTTHLCMGFNDNDEFGAWINGQPLQVLSDVNGGMNTVDLDFNDGATFGIFGGLGNDFFDGSVDEYYLYSGLLTDQDAEAIYLNLTNGTQYPFTTPECFVDNDCDFCETCNAGTCQTPTFPNDPKNECDNIVTACNNNYQYTEQDGFCHPSTPNICNFNTINVADGNVCKNNVSFNVNPDGAVNCDIYSQCSINATSAEEYYVGYTGLGNGLCSTTDPQITGTNQTATTGFQFNNSGLVPACTEQPIPSPPPAPSSQLEATDAPLIASDIIGKIAVGFGSVAVIVGLAIALLAISTLYRRR